MGKHASTIRAIAQFGANDQPAQPQPATYPYIRAWSRYMEAHESLTNDRIAQAERDQAPQDVVFIDMENKWRTIDQIKNDALRTQIHAIAAQHFGVPLPVNRCDWCGYKTPHLSNKPTYDGSAGAGRGYHILCRRCVARYNREAKEYKARQAKQ